MNEIELKYGCNLSKAIRIFMGDGSELPCSAKRKTRLY